MEALITHSIAKTPCRTILWCPTKKMHIKACFFIQPLEQEGGCQKCCISLCTKVFINHFYQVKENPECLNILTYWSKCWVDRLRRTIRMKVKCKQEYFINRYIDLATIFYIKLPTSTAALLVVNSVNHYWVTGVLGIVAWWCYIVQEIWVSTSSGNGLLPDNTKPLPESMLNNHQWGLLAFTYWKFHM